MRGVSPLEEEERNDIISSDGVTRHSTLTHVMNVSLLCNSFKLKPFSSRLRGRSVRAVQQQRHRVAEQSVRSVEEEAGESWWEQATPTRLQNRLGEYMYIIFISDASI